MVQTVGPNVGPFDKTNPFMDIIKTMSDIETLRENRMMETSVLTALSRGASPEELLKIVNQPVQFDEGVPGFFQRIAARYAQPSPLKTAVTQAAAKETISPDKVTMSDIRMREYLKAIQAGDSERADKLLMSSLVTIETGQKLLSPEQRQAIADRDYEERLGLSASDMTNARRSADAIVKRISPRTWTKVGMKNYTRNALIQGYKQYRAENQYQTKTAQNRKDLDGYWDSQIETFNKAGYLKHGKNEFDWDPKDEKVVELRKEKANKVVPAGLESIWGSLTKEEKETAKDYISQKISPEKIVEWFNTNE